MAYSSAIPRQLAPTVGQEALQALQWARTKIFAGIGKTIAIGRVLFSGNVPIVPPPPPTSSGSRRRRTLCGARSFLSETSTSSSAKPTQALVPWKSEEHQDPHGPPTGRIRSRKDRCRISLRILPAKIGKIQDPHGPPTGRTRSRKDRCRISLQGLPTKIRKIQGPPKPPLRRI